jgi:ribonucleotide monophosphatase NagD (HAD superfamily)
MNGGIPELCAGAIADAYEEIGGRVEWYGKPYPAVYEHAFRIAGDPPRESVLAVGDGLRTDMLGAARKGLDAVFVRGAFDDGKPFPSHFGRANGLGDWRPIAVADGLA